MTPTNRWYRLGYDLGRILRAVLLGPLHRPRPYRHPLRYVDLELEHRIWVAMLRRQAERDAAEIGR